MGICTLYYPISSWLPEEFCQEGHERENKRQNERTWGSTCLPAVTFSDHHLQWDLALVARVSYHIPRTSSIKPYQRYPGDSAPSSEVWKPDVQSHLPVHWATHTSQPVSLSQMFPGYTTNLLDTSPIKEHTPLLWYLSQSFRGPFSKSLRNQHQLSITL